MFGSSIKVSTRRIYIRFLFVGTNRLWIRREELQIGSVNLSVVVHARQEDRRLHDAGGAGACFF